MKTDILLTYQNKLEEIQQEYSKDSEAPKLMGLQATEELKLSLSFKGDSDGSDLSDESPKFLTALAGDETDNIINGSKQQSIY